MQSSNPYNPLQPFMSIPMSTNDDGTNNNPALTVPTETVQAAQASATVKDVSVVPVSFPKHLFIPEGAESLDLRRVVSIPGGMVDYLLMEFTAPIGALTRFIGYGVYNDGYDANDFTFLPTVDNSRIFRYHGDPMHDYRIALGLAPDLGNEAIIPCQVTLQPNQTLRWYISNRGAVAANMGVRMIGYFDTSSTRTGTSLT